MVGILHPCSSRPFHPPKVNLTKYKVLDWSVLHHGLMIKARINIANTFDLDLHHPQVPPPLGIDIHPPFR